MKLIIKLTSNKRIKKGMFNESGAEYNESIIKWKNKRINKLMN